MACPSREAERLPFLFALSHPLAPLRPVLAEDLGPGLAAKA